MYSSNSKSNYIPKIRLQGLILDLNQILKIVIDHCLDLNLELRLKPSLKKLQSGSDPKAFAGYSGDLDAQVLEIPYRERGASLFVFLPRDRNTGRELDDMLRQFQPASLRPAIGNLVKRDVLLKFPKFRLENSLRSELTGVSLPLVR